MKRLLLCGLMIAGWQGLFGQMPVDEYPSYKGEVLPIRIEDPIAACDSVDTVRNTVYCWTYTHNRWFARVFVYFDQNFEYIQAKYMALMAIGPDKNWSAIYIGNFYDYRRKGVLHSVIAFNEGVRNGPARYYNRHGILSQEGQYLKEMRVGLWRYYDRKGNLRYEVDYRQPASPIDPGVFNSTPSQRP
jgi:hypothetical protein